MGSTIPLEHLEAAGLPESVEVTVDLHIGAAYIKLNRDKILNKEISCSTVADVGDIPNINVDVAEVDGKEIIVGLEDISKEMLEIVKRWVAAIAYVKAQQL